VGPELLHLEKLKQIIGVHAVLDFEEDMKLGMFAIAVRFHGLEVVGEKRGVPVFVPVFECFPRGSYLRFEQVGELGLSRRTL
jgi:hypothetical protein